MFVVSIVDRHNPLHERQWHGSLPDTARFLVHCHEPSFLEDCGSQRVARSVTGNAYSVPMLARALSPLVARAVQMGVLTNPKQPPLTRNALLSLAEKRDRKRRRVDSYDVD